MGFGVTYHLCAALPGEENERRKRGVFEHLAEVQFVVVETVNRAAAGVEEDVVGFAAGLNNDFAFTPFTEFKEEAEDGFVGPPGRDGTHGVEGYNGGEGDVGGEVRHYHLGAEEDGAFVFFKVSGDGTGPFVGGGGRVIEYHEGDFGKKLPTFVFDLLDPNPTFAQAPRTTVHTDISRPYSFTRGTRQEPAFFDPLSVVRP